LHSTILKIKSWQPRALLVTLIVIAAAALLSPAEATLGWLMKLVFLHGTWVWAGILIYGLASLAGLAGFAALLAGRSAIWARLSQTFGWTGLFFWLTYLPMSMIVTYLSWGGFFFAEPRWRIPLTFAIGGILLQAGLYVMGDLRLTTLGNLIFGAALWASVLNVESVLHPDSPVSNSGSALIQVVFIGMLLLALIFGLQLAAWWFRSPPVNTDE
jgi:hypothetical protein